MELSDVYEALNRYFSSLTHLGYKSYEEVSKLLILIFIEELLNGDFAQFVTERDYISISNSLECMYGTCMIPYPDYKSGVTIPVTNVLSEYRITENDTLRASEESLRGVC